MNKPAGKASIQKVIRKIYFNSGADVMNLIYKNREEFSKEKFVQEAGVKREQKNVDRLKMKSNSIIIGTLMGLRNSNKQMELN